MVDAAMVELAVDAEGIIAPDHRDVAVHLDRRVAELLLVAFGAGLDGGGEVGPAHLADGAGAVGLLGRDGGAALRRDVREDDARVAGGERLEDGVDRDHHRAHVGRLHRQGGALGERRHRRDLRGEEEQREDHAGYILKDAELRALGDRRVQCDGESEAEDVAGLDGIDDAVVPQPRGLA